jgi:threonine dehydrogenase-like Zn-dependent dehydrogenase
MDTWIWAAGLVARCGVLCASCWRGVKVQVQVQVQVHPAQCHCMSRCRAAAVVGQAEYVMVPYADFNALRFPDKDHAMEKIQSLALLADILPTGCVLALCCPPPRPVRPLL